MNKLVCVVVLLLFALIIVGNMIDFKSSSISNNVACAAESSENVKYISIPYSPYGNSSPIMTSADFDGDGDIDLAVVLSARQETKVFILKNDGEGNFSLK